MRKIVTKKFSRKVQVELDSLYRRYEWFITKLAIHVAEMCGAAIEDLKQEGFLGLARAHDLYDPKVASFLTYAQHWIRMAMFSYAYRAGYVASIPEDFHSLYSRYHKKLAEAGGKLCMCELAAKMNISVTRLRKMLKTVRMLKSKTDLDDVDRFGLAKDSATEISDAVLSRVEGSSGKLLQRVRDLVTPEEYFVLNHLLALEVNSPKTLSWVGAILGVTKERVRQIKNCALNKIREKIGTWELDCLLELPQ